MLRAVRKLRELDEQARWAEELAQGHRAKVVNAAFPPNDAAAATFAENADDVAREYRREAMALRRRLVLSVVAAAAVVLLVGAGVMFLANR